MPGRFPPRAERERGGADLRAAVRRRPRSPPAAHGAAGPASCRAAMAGPGTLGDASRMVMRTDRLDAVPLGPEHLDALAPVMADPRVAATMGGRASADAGRRDARRQRRPPGRARLRLLGVVRARHRRARRPRRPAPRRSSAAAPRSRSAGSSSPSAGARASATELGAAALEHALRRAAASSASSPTRCPPTRRSRRVMDEARLRPTSATCVHAGLPHVLYARGPDPARRPAACPAAARRGVGSAAWARPRSPNGGASGPARRAPDRGRRRRLRRRRRRR